MQAGTRADRLGMRRETIDPDDFTGGFALWSGTSFAAPYVAGRLALALVDPLAQAQLGADDCARALNRARDEVLDELSLQVLGDG